MNVTIEIDAERYATRAMVHASALFLRTFASAWCVRFEIENQRRRTVLDYARACKFHPAYRGRVAVETATHRGTVIAGPPVPDGSGETLWKIRGRRGNHVALACVWDGRPPHRNERGRVFAFDADDLPLVFGVLRRGELVKYRHELRRRGVAC
jgi:hypothetical protein